MTGSSRIGRARHGILDWGRVGSDGSPQPGSASSLTASPCHHLVQSLTALPGGEPLSGCYQEVKTSGCGRGFSFLRLCPRGSLETWVKEASVGRAGQSPRHPIRRAIEAVGHASAEPGHQARRGAGGGQLRMSRVNRGERTCRPSSAGGHDPTLLSRQRGRRSYGVRGTLPELRRAGHHARVNCECAHTDECSAKDLMQHLTAPSSWAITPTPADSSVARAVPNRSHSRLLLVRPDYTFFPRQVSSTAVVCPTGGGGILASVRRDPGEMERIAVTLPVARRSARLLEEEDHE
jgi:hypothetical protein